MFESIELTLMPSNYLPRNKKIEVMLNEESGYAWLQVVDGCGYEVYSLTPSELIVLGHQLLKAAELLKDEKAKEAKNQKAYR